MLRTGLFTLAAGASLAAAAAFTPGTAEARPAFGYSGPGFSMYVGPRYGYDRPYHNPYYGPGYGGYGYHAPYNHNYGPYAYSYDDGWRHRRYHRKRWRKDAFTGE